MKAIKSDKAIADKAIAKGDLEAQELASQEKTQIEDVLSKAGDDVKKGIFWIGFKKHAVHEELGFLTFKSYLENRTTKQNYEQVRQRIAYLCRLVTKPTKSANRKISSPVDLIVKYFKKLSGKQMLKVIDTLTAIEKAIA